MSAIVVVVVEPEIWSNPVDWSISPSTSESAHGACGSRLSRPSLDLFVESFGGGFVCAFVEVAVDVEDGSY